MIFRPYILFLSAFLKEEKTMEMIKKPKGTMDLYGLDAKKYVYIETLIHELCEKYNYRFIKTPTFECSELYHRGVGETTDIVTKETYDFVDRGNRNMTLRPEGTAGVVRSYIENKMDNEPLKPQKFYYIAPAFRYERPQSGRLREHTQFGVEVLGSDSPLIDAEVISLAVNFYQLLGLKGIKVKLNSLGDNASRVLYKEALINHFKPHILELCEDCQNRLEKNPLRILDCKVDSEHALMKSAPKTLDYLNQESLERFQDLQSILSDLGIEYEIDTNLVRGLDYYNHTVFEIQYDRKGFGSQSTLCGGGRYNTLVESLGGSSVPAIGFGIGLERLLLALEEEEISLTENDRLDFYLINLCTDKKIPLLLANELRIQGVSVDLDFMDKNLKGQFKNVERLNPKYFAVIGDDEISKQMIKIKDNDTKEEKEVPIDDILNFFEGV